MRKRNLRKKSTNNSIKKNKIPKDRFKQESERPYLENYKTWMREIEDDTNKWKYILCSWIVRINIG